MRLWQLMSENDNKVLDLIARDISYANYFFRKVKGPRWLFLLKGRGYFNPRTIQRDEKTNLTLFWNVLDYLERISELVLEDENLEYGKELLTIIDNTVQYSRQELKLSNYHIWWFFVKILNNLPAKLIVENVTVQQFENWLLEWTDPKLGSDLALHNIAVDLLGKFLDKEATIPFAEAIIKVITRIRETEKKTTKYEIFDRHQDARMAWSSYGVLDGFRKYHTKIGEKCSEQVVYLLADTLKWALEYRQKDNYVIFDIGTAVYQVKVSRMRQEDLPEGEIGFQDGIYDCQIRQYTEEQLKGIDRQKDFWALHKNELRKLLDQFRISDVSIKDKFRLTIIKAILGKNINLEGDEEYERNMEYLYDGLFEDYSHIWFRSLTDSGHFHSENAQSVLTVILKDVLLSKCKVNQEESMRILRAFLTFRYPFPLFKRFVLLCITENSWEVYGNLFLEALNAVPNIFAQSDYEVELYDLLKKHNKNFDEPLNERIMKLIENVPDYYKKEGPKLVAYWKYTRLSPLKDNPFFKADYEREKQKAEVKEDKPFELRRSTVQMSWGASKSPLSKDQIAEMDIRELVGYLKDFQGSDDWGRLEGKPDKEGLADALKEAVKENPQKFIDCLEFFNTDNIYRYVNSILAGLRDAWNAGKPLAWGKIFDFCKEYVNRPKFMDEAIKDQGEDSGKFKGKYIWTVDAIAYLIEEGSRNDERAFEKEFFDKGEKVFESLLIHVKGEKQPDTQRDAVNTSLGKVIESYIIFSLRVARVRQKAGEEKTINWGRDKYERFFDRGIEAFIFLGRYLPNLKFLDGDWAKQKIQESSNWPEFEWQQFMEAYLTGPYLYQDIYEWMRKNYTKAIENKVFEESVDHRLVEHITMGYLRGYDNLNERNPDGKESLFWRLLHESFASEKRDRWPEVASFLWSITGKREEKKKERELSEEFIKKILDFWKWTFDHREDLKQKLEDVYPSLLCNLAELTIILDKIDEEKEQWLMLSAPHVERHHFSSFFIEYLTLFQDKKNIKRIGRIFLKVLEHTTPTFKQEDVITVVQKLFDGDDEDQNNARKICNTYGQRGVHFLKDLYYAHQ
jgi:hypothetical protein